MAKQGWAWRGASCLGLVVLLGAASCSDDVSTDTPSEGGEGGEGAAAGSPAQAGSQSSAGRQAGGAGNYAGDAAGGDRGGRATDGGTPNVVAGAPPSGGAGAQNAAGNAGESGAGGGQSPPEVCGEGSLAVVGQRGCFACPGYVFAPYPITCGVFAGADENGLHVSAGHYYDPVTHRLHMLAGNDLPEPVSWTAGHQYTFESPEQENACNAQVTFSIEGTELVADLTALVACAGLEQVVLIDAKANYACTESLNSNAYLTIDFTVEPPQLATACESSPDAPIMFQQLEPYPGPQRFSGVAGGAIADATTGLVWEQRADGQYGSFSEADAEAHCEQLDYAGFSDWRLPNPYELFSLVNFRAHLPGPLIDLSVFPNTPASTFWAKGAWVPADGAGWTIDFGASDPGYMFAGGADLGDSNAARCVRAGKSAAPRFAVNADGTVTDSLNDLTWQRDAGTSLTPDQAQAHCRYLNLAGGGWRVPTILELASLADYTKQDPAIDTTVFTSTPGAQWSTTPFFDVDHSGWAIEFYDGSAVGGGDSSDSPLNVRCVR